VVDLSVRLTRPLSGFWKVFGDLHRSVYLGSSGRLGSRLAWIPMLLLSTQGRKTGLVRTMPLAFMSDPEQQDTYVIVASNGGNERPPAWWLNIQANPIATVQVGRESFLARAELAPPERRKALWQELRQRIPPYRSYERIEREIPIVLLRRLRPASRESAARDLPAARAA
jgi:deazaflavin-dependent oxidoreductase (nitroreductase family)